MEDDKIIAERKEKLINFFKGNPNWIFLIVVILLVILGVYIRMQPLLDHGGRPGLWDVTTNDYTLGPDLDPFLFLRYAKTMVSEGTLPQYDLMRNVPLGFDTKKELQMVSYMIVITYKILNLFGNYSINYAGAFMPVPLFALTIIAFFLFVREIFMRKDDKEITLKANLIASISTLFMIVSPGFLSRTVAGIPEKESVAFLFMFLSFYLFIKAWKSEKLFNAGIFGILSGIATALMGLTWGGVVYVYATIAIAFFAAMILGKVHRKEALVYFAWVLLSLAITFSFTNKFSIKSYVTSLDTGIVIFNLAFLAAHFLIWRTGINEKLNLNRFNLPKPLISLLIAIILGIIAVSAVLGPGFLIERIKALNQTLIQPLQGRWNTTVAENKQPYFNEWVGNFGKPVFWAFITGSILLFRRMLNKLERKEAYVLTAFYFFFLFGLIFSRYAPHPALLDGEGTISKLLYYGSSLLLVGSLGSYYVVSHRKDENPLSSAEFENILLFSLFILTLFTARSAVRLIMVLVPIAPIFLAYLVIEIGAFSLNYPDKSFKAIFVIFSIILLSFSAYQAYGFYNSVKSEAYNFVPNMYTVQWQKAMSWVRDNTPQDAVFVHWWDYGYWLQSIGNRATVTDGGNAIVWWNYLTGRFVLTGDNQADALEFLYNHNATYLLIDSSDIGKYGAYSQIGSDENFDRLSQGPFALVSDQRNMQETKNKIIRLYNMPSGDNRVLIFPIEEDIDYDSDDAKIHLFKENSGLIGVSLNYSIVNNTPTFNQPRAIFASKGQDYVQIPIRYLKYKDQFYDFKSGIESGIHIIQKVSQNSNRLEIDEYGALIFLSPRVFRGLMGQLYVLDDSLGRFSNFNLVHSEPNYIINSLNQQGTNLGEFTYITNYGLQGPIKIWEISYTGEEKINPEYLRTSVPDYITWSF